jgi:hypothetical protein
MRLHYPGTPQTNAVCRWLRVREGELELTLRQRSTHR